MFTMEIPGVSLLACSLSCKEGTERDFPKPNFGHFDVLKKRKKGTYTLCRKSSHHFSILVLSLELHLRPTGRQVGRDFKKKRERPQS